MHILTQTLIVLTAIVFLFTRPCNVACAWCGCAAERQPVFIKHFFPLPNTVHYECAKEWGTYGGPLRYTSYMPLFR